MKIEVVKTPKGRAVKAGEIYAVDLGKKHWMCKIIGLDPKFGLNRDFLGRAFYDTKGKAGGYIVDSLKPGDIIEEAGGSGKKVYKEYARVVGIDDSALEFEYMRENDVQEHFKAADKTTKAIASR
jgi:hypothetical protein